VLNRSMIAPVDYRDAMARYAGHVQIVTTERDGLRRGVTVTASCSVSDEPPTVLVCLNRINPRNALFFEGDSFALNTLSARHRLLAEAIAGFGNLPEEERFGRGLWDTIVTGAPTLIDAAAVFDCRITDRKEMSTHTVVFGEVVGLRLGPQEAALIYHERRFRDL
jgi:cob(II)yrinic acid a,c-diamide reductase